MISLSAALDLLKQTGREVADDNCTSMSAAIAYYTLLSLPPLLATLVGVAGAVFGAETVQEQITGQLGSLLGESGGDEVRTMIENASTLGGGSVGGKVLALLALLLGATGAFVQLQQSLNRAWEVQPDDSGSGVVSFLTKRVLSFGMVLTIAFLLIVSLAASALLSGLFGVVEEALGSVGAVFAYAGQLAVSLALFAFLFAAIFKVLPDAHISWRDVWVGGAATALLFVLGKFLIGFYLGRSDPGEAFGAAGSVVVILVWIYYTALILLVGAEFTQVWARRFGSRIVPDEDAVRVVETERVVRTSASPPEAEEPAEREEATAPDAAHPYAAPRDPQPRSGWNE
ncbi:MAG: YihY/virulence factor BrkB family protein [Bacteroidota bacterium]